MPWLMPGRFFANTGKEIIGLKPKKNGLGFEKEGCLGL